MCDTELQVHVIVFFLLKILMITDSLSTIEVLFATEIWIDQANTDDNNHNVFVNSICVRLPVISYIDPELANK